MRRFQIWEVQFPPPPILHWREVSTNIDFVFIQKLLVWIHTKTHTYNLKQTWGRMVLYFFFFFSVKAVSWSYQHNDLTYIFKGRAGWYSIILVWHTLISLTDLVVLLFFFLGQCKPCYSECPSTYIFTHRIMDIGKISVGYISRSGVAGSKYLYTLLHFTILISMFTQ